MPQGEAEFDSADFARLLHQNKYRLVAKKGEGTFSEVLKAQSLLTGESYAIKCMKSPFKTMDQVNSLREIQALRRLNPHPNVIDLEEVLYDPSSGRLALVFELMDHNVYELIRGRKTHVKNSTVKNLMFQLMKAVAHMHKHGIFHRDIKPENILLLGDSLLKVADYGSCRGIYTPAPYTEYISTRWYRAPECLLTNGYYDFKMDCFGVGCVMFEVVALFPLFPGANELDQIEKIHAVLGTPSQEMLDRCRLHSSHIKNFHFPPRQGSGIARLIPHAPPDMIDLLERLLAYDPEERLTARQALRHPYFRELREAEKRERIRTASPKLVRSVGSRGGVGAEMAADGTEEDGANTAASSGDHALPAPHVVAPREPRQHRKHAAAAAAGHDGPSAPHKKFPSIAPAHNGGTGAHAAAAASSGGGGGVSLPSAFDKGHGGASSSLPAVGGGAGGGGGGGGGSHASGATAAASSSLTSMPHIGHKHAPQGASLASLSASSESLPPTAADGGASPSPAPATRKQPKGSKAHKAAAALLAAQQLLLEKQLAEAAANAAAVGGSPIDTLSESGSMRSGDGVDEGVNSPSSGAADALEALAAKERALQRAKEKQKERALHNASSSAASAAASSAAGPSGGAAVAAAPSKRTGGGLHKNSSQHKLPTATGAAYQQYSIQQAAATGASGGRHAKQKAAPANALLPSLGGKLDQAAALAAARAAAAAVAQQQQQQQQQLHSKSSASLQHAPSSHASPSGVTVAAGGASLDDDYSYDDDTVSEAASSVLEPVPPPAASSTHASAAAAHQHAPSHSHKKKPAAAAAGSSSLSVLSGSGGVRSKGKGKGGASAAGLAPGHSPLIAPLPVGASSGLSLDGHTAPMSLHSSSSSSQLRGSYPGKAGKTKTGALSLALQSLSVADTAKARKGHA